MLPINFLQMNPNIPDHAHSPHRPSRWRDLLPYYLFFFYFSGIYQAFVYFGDIADMFGLIQALVISLLWLVPVLLFPAHARIIAGGIGSLLWASSLFSLGYLALYHQDFSQSVIFIIFESNWAESSEYLESYFAWWMIPALAIYTLVPWLMWRRLRPISLPVRARMALATLLCLAVFWPGLKTLYIKHGRPALAARFQADHMEPAAPWQLLIGYAKYRVALAASENGLLRSSPRPHLEGLVDSNADLPATLVLVIGESTNGRRMALYGYPRDTTPQLSAMAGDLLVFDQVYAPRPYTVETVEQVLSFADQLHPKRYLESPTLIDIMKQAGYRTYWISNQQTQTQRNTLLTTFSKQADEQIYLNNNRSQNSAQYDQVVFKPFQDIINNGVKRKFILVHLIGTHRAYRYRYPPEFAVFTDPHNTPPWLRTTRQRREYNEYDNAVRYNDFVVSSLIRQLRNSRQNGFLTYFSDHGEEVYDFPKRLFAGRSEASPTWPMYSVPFLIWRSKGWRARNPIADPGAMAHRLYSTSDFIYTWLDLAGIRFDGFDPSRSIVNRQYQTHPVLIGDPAKPQTLTDIRQLFFSRPTGSEARQQGGQENVPTLKHP